MKPDLIAQLPRTQREAVESAGYRIVRWVAAREVLQARVSKGRIAGLLGEFMTHWLSLAPAVEADSELWLSFDYALDQAKLKLAGGSATLAQSPLEQALLHLPALRPFWSQELRLQHFEALRNLVPQAWLLDSAEVPPGAVIQGLGKVSWERVPQLREQEWEILDSRGRVLTDWPSALASNDSILTSRLVSNVVLNASYGRNDKDQVVLRSLEAAP
ncbi:MAG: hypothetical protein K9N47_21360 [Prosthecobacter sp.]|uniref:hypothetical protein n=1 Tax=Prosthecobacter sp. TaxID=1965333 RepID=UPI0026382376|nr:hypothetical protein [Prosthecobacter sp.]MCF7788686.1 hypothetical protein [Prosthecobacter sp.]